MNRARAYRFGGWELNIGLRRLKDPQGRPVQSRAVYFAKGTQVFQAAVYGPRLPDEALDAFFAGLQLSPP